MSTFKKTWIDDYSEGRFSLKDHCNGKPHVKALHSLKASVLKMSDKVGQKDVGSKKANIAYFAAKNDILFGKLPNLVDLVTRKGNVNFEKDIQSLNVSKDGCWEIMIAHGEVSVMNVVIAVSKFSLVSILMDESAIHGKKKEVEYIQSFQREEFKKGRNPTVTQLLNLIDVRDASPNTPNVSPDVAVIACFDRFFGLIKEYYMDEISQKNFFRSRWTEHQ